MKPVSVTKNANELFDPNMITNVPIFYSSLLGNPRLFGAFFFVIYSFHKGMITTDSQLSSRWPMIFGSAISLILLQNRKETTGTNDWNVQVKQDCCKIPLDSYGE